MKPRFVKRQERRSWERFLKRERIAEFQACPWRSGPPKRKYRGPVGFVLATYPQLIAREPATGIRIR
jgi:hypothetical protein